MRDARPLGFRCEPCGAGPGFEARPDPDVFFLDYPIKLASKVVRSTHSASRRRLLAGVRRLLASEQRVQGSKIARQLKKVVGVDWSPAPAGGARPALSASLSVGSAGKAEAGKPLKIAVTVKNAAGAGVAYRVRGLLYSTYTPLQHRELFFGKIAPGAERRVALTVKLRKGLSARADDVSIKLFAANGAPPPPICSLLRVAERPKPRFVYTWQMLDDVVGNGDGQLQPGESVRLRVQVKNVGKGAAEETYLRLKSLSGDAVTVGKGLYALTGLKPGATRVLTLDFKVMQRMPLPKVKLKLSVGDCTMGRSVSEVLKLKIAPAAAGPARARGLFRPKRDGVPVYQSPRQERVIGLAPARARFAVEARDDNTPSGHYRIRLGRRSTGFVRVSDMVRVRRGRPRPTLSWSWLPSAPKITISKVAEVTSAGQITISGLARHKTRVSDVYISVTRLLRSADHSRIIGVDSNKIFYRANRLATGGSLPFKAVVPLWEGANVINVVARHNDEIKTSHTLRVLRTTCRRGRPTRLPRTSAKIP